MVSAKGTIDIAENGSFEVNEDCSVHFELTLPASNGQPELAMTMRQCGTPFIKQITRAAVKIA